MPPTFVFANRNRTQCCLSGFTISWLLENIIFKPSLGNGSRAIKNDTRLLYFELLVLNHAGLGCGSMAEPLPTVSKAPSSIPSTIKPVIHCGKPGTVVQTCNPSTQGQCCGRGVKAGRLSLRLVWAIKKIVFSCANIHNFTSWSLNTEIFTPPLLLFYIFNVFLMYLAVIGNSPEPRASHM